MCNSDPLSHPRIRRNWKWDYLGKICGGTSCLMEWMLRHTWLCEGSMSVIRMAYTWYPILPSQLRQSVTENCAESFACLQGSYWSLLTADVSVPPLKLHIWEMSYSTHGHTYACLLCCFFFNIVEISMEGASKVSLDTRASYIFWEQDNYLPKQLSSLWRRSGQGYFLSWPQMVTFTW